ncbi:MAG: hypothetical protein ACJA0G_002562 [Kangiellaceae bacterium]
MHKTGLWFNKPTYTHFWLLATLFILPFPGVVMVTAAGEPLYELKKVGEAKLKVLFWDVYISSLYSLTGEYQALQFPQALEINYLRDVDAKDIINRIQDEWKKLDIKPALFKLWIPLLADIFPNIKKGDTLLFKVNENQHGEFFFNGQPIGKITDKTFGTYFLRIWLDEKCSYPIVRDRLIGLKK